MIACFSARSILLSGPDGCHQAARAPTGLTAPARDPAHAPPLRRRQRAGFSRWPVPFFLLRRARSMVVGPECPAIDESPTGSTRPPQPFRVTAIPERRAGYIPPAVMRGARYFGHAGSGLPPASRMIRPFSRGRRRMSGQAESRMAPPATGGVQGFNGRSPAPVRVSRAGPSASFTLGGP